MSIEIVLPKEGQIWSSATVSVSVLPLNFTYLVRSPAENIDGMGKVAVYLNVEPPTATGKSGLTDKGTYVTANSDNILFKGVKPGKHTIWVQLLQNDNTPLNPPVVAKVTFTVEYEVSPSPTPK